MSIDVLGDRRNTGYCLMCGTLLMIEPWNEYQCCPKCTEIIETVVKSTIAKKDPVPLGGKSILNKSIMRQLRPLNEEHE